MADKMEQNQEIQTLDQQDQTDPTTFKLQVIFPNNSSLPFTVHPAVSIAEILNQIAEYLSISLLNPENKENKLPEFLTCFHLESPKGVVISNNEALEIKDLYNLSPSETETIKSLPEMYVVEGTYNSKEIRDHLIKVREVFTKYESTCINPLSHGIDYSLSLLSTIPGSLNSIDKIPSTAPHEIKEVENVDFGQTDGNLDLKDIFKYYRKDSRDNDNSDCIKSIKLSIWEPIPYARKLAGDLIYLDVVTMEGTNLCITGCTTGFFVSNSTLDKFDPTPRSSPNTHSHNLPGCISICSPLFSKNFGLLQKFLVKEIHPYANLPAVATQGSYPWCVIAPPHTTDTGRRLDDYIASFETIENSSRDWNEDIQSLREIEITNHGEKVLKEQTACKQHNDFIAAAINGAISISDKSLTALNGSEPEDTHLFLTNNIFYSQGYDGSREQFEHIGGKEASELSFSKDIDGIASLIRADIPGVFTLGTCVMDYKGRRVIAQTMIPGILKKAIGSTDEHNELVNYGSVDGGRTIFCKDGFKEVVDKISGFLHLEPHKLLDAKGETHVLATSVDTKGILGNDGRKYFLDLYRTNPVDIEFLELIDSKKSEEGIEYPHRLCLLRSELVDSFYENKFRQFAEENRDLLITFDKLREEATKEIAEREKQGIVGLELLQCSSHDALKQFEKKLDANVRFNTDMFTPTLSGEQDPEIILQQENLIRQASSYVHKAISKMIKAMVSNPTKIPADTNILTRTFHAYGINMRYLGKVAANIESMDFPAPFFNALLKEEMISRSAKKILRNLIFDTPDYHVQRLISHFFNCLFTDKIATTAESFVDGEVSPTAFSSAAQACPHLSSMASNAAKVGTTGDFNKLTSASVKEMIISQVLKRFFYVIDDATFDQLVSARFNSLLRSICLKVGIQIECKDYASIKKNKELIFESGNILNLFPIIKHAEPKVSTGDEIIELGQRTIMESESPEILEQGLSVLLEGVMLLENTLTRIHPNAARAYATCATFHYHLRKMATAVEFQRKAVIVSERCNGLDDPDTIDQYTQLSFYEHISGNFEVSLKLLKHAINLWRIHCPALDHPQIPATLITMSVLLMEMDDLKQEETTLKQVVSIYENINNKNLQESAVIAYEMLSTNQIKQGKESDAHANLKKCYDFFYKTSPSDEKTLQLAGRLKQLSITMPVDVDLSVPGKSEGPSKAEGPSKKGTNKKRTNKKRAIKKTKK